VRAVRTRLAIAASLTLACCVSAHADTIQTSVGVTINALSGKHEVAGGNVDNVNFVPIPIFEIESRYRRTRLRLENIPSVPFSYGDNNAQSTRLGMLNVSLRQALGSIVIGVGETIYNQHTYYPREFNIDGSTQQYSRVVGLSYEIGQTIVLPHRQTLELRLGGDPVMHGVQYSAASNTLCPLSRKKLKPNCDTVSYVSGVSERAAQLDIGARLTRRVGRGDAIFGLRYLNYTARYVTGTYFYGDGGLADRNVGILPLIGYRLRL
jgi:ribosomal protein L28